MIYGERSNGREHGVVLTKASVVEKMLDLVGYKDSCDLRDIRVVEPSSGEGAFALPIIKRLYKSSERFNFNFQIALFNLKFFDIDERSLNEARKKITVFLEETEAQMVEGMFNCHDFLTAKVSRCDLVIGNPPYVRHENIPEEQKKTYRKEYRTFTHRSDLYIPFYEKGLRILKEGGSLTYICSNRWLKNQYGKELRKMIASEFSIKEIIDLENVDAFQESVIAYPAITTISRDKSLHSASYFRLDDLESLEQFDSSSKPTRILNSNSSNWFAVKYARQGVSTNLTSIVEQGFKIGIGVATGKDSVFIRKDFEELVEHELLLPLLTSRGVRGDEIIWQGNFVINPYDPNGGLIDLTLFPKASSYFHKHFDALSNRHVSKKNPDNWYRTIDKIQFSLINKPKILLPDITGNKIIHIDKGDYYPHHNLYYITGKDQITLEILAALLMSDFVKNQLDEVGNKMSGGYPRWQSQNIRKLRIPYLDSIPKHMKKELIRAYRSKNLEMINSLVTLENISLFERTAGQLMLFEPEVQYSTSSKQENIN